MNNLFSGVINSFKGQYHFLSNFYPCEVEYKGVVWPTLEHAYVSAKIKNYDDVEKLLKTCDTPGKAKRFGRKVEIVDNWDSIKFNIMYKLLCKKFDNPVLLQKLKDTGDKLLVEGNDHGDVIWGVCNKTGKGANKLGQLLMFIRDTGV
jgi:hypothetical protein